MSGTTSFSDALREAQHGATGEPLTIALPVGTHDVDANVSLVFDHQTAASELWLIGSKGALLEIGLLQIVQGAPVVHIWDLEVIGLIRVDGGELEMNNTVLSGDRTVGHHRALAEESTSEEVPPLLHVLDGSAVTLQNATIEGGQGGGVILSNGTLWLYDCFVLRNRASHGGGLRVDAGHAIVARTTLQDNRATVSGGGLYIGGGGIAELQDQTQLDSNHAPTGNSIFLASGGSFGYMLVREKSDFARDVAHPPRLLTVVVRMLRRSLLLLPTG